MNRDELWVDQLWDRLISKIQEPSGEGRGEYIVYTTHHRKRNMIRVFDEHLERISTGRPQKIKKKHVIQFARGAKDDPNHLLSIADPKLKPGWMGSIV